MTLNPQGLNELRKKIEEQLVNVLDGQRIHLDKELLDDLIFFKGKNKEGKVIKVPIWTGQFLRKIDLSEISFENVLFQSGKKHRGDLNEIMDAEDVSKFIKKGDDSYPQYFAPFVNGDIIDLSYTNANIDFSKIYGTTIEGCNFEGLDFSNANGPFIEQIYYSNFTNTNISIDFNHENLYLMCSNFSNNDFSHITVDANFFNYEEVDEFRFNGANFSNTGLNINYTNPQIPPIFYEELAKEKEAEELYQNGSISEDEYIERMRKHREITLQYLNDAIYKLALGEAIKDGYLNGCYINGKKVHSLEEKQAIAQEKQAEYEKIKEDLISITTNSIEQQTSGFGR